MVNKPKIKIVNDADLRQRIEKNANLISQAYLAGTEEREWQLYELNKYIRGETFW